jgi:hypothetical protein
MGLCPGNCKNISKIELTENLEKHNRMYDLKQESILPTPVNPAVEVFQNDAGKCI